MTALNLDALGPFTDEPTRDELDAAWATLHGANVSRIVNITIGEIGRIAAGNPNYSPAEIRMAGGLLVLRAALAKVSR